MRLYLSRLRMHSNCVFLAVKGYSQSLHLRFELMAEKTLLSIVEIGGYPDFTSLYESMGYEVILESRMRKVLKRLKKQVPDVVVAEFNFQSDFRDRTSSLESLMALVTRNPSTKTIIFYDKEYEHQLARLEERFDFDFTLPFPIDKNQLEAVIFAFG